jgi:hypothetical protein
MNCNSKSMLKHQESIFRKLLKKKKLIGQANHPLGLGSKEKQKIWLKKI